MAAPNLGSTAKPAYSRTLFDAQLASGDNEFTVPTGKTWALKSLSLCNTGSTAVVVALRVKPAGGSAFRAIVVNFSLPAATVTDGSNSLSLDAGKHLPGLLADGAVIRITASAATAVDVLATGTELG